MQYENVAPMEYFVKLVAQFETDMTEYRKQINQTQQHIQVGGDLDDNSVADPGRYLTDPDPADRKKTGSGSGSWSGSGS